jgi:hypothetical protein
LFACGALSIGLMAGAPVLLGAARAQTAIVDPNAPKASQSSHDAALAAAARRDYVSALELSKKAASEGQPLDSDQVDFISGKAAQQQALADDAAKTKAEQVAVQDQAQKIMDRQQKDYAERAERAKKAAQVNANACSQQAAAVGQFTNDYGAAANNILGGKAFAGMPAGPPPVSNDRPGNC